MGFLIALAGCVRRGARKCAMAQARRMGAATRSRSWGCLPRLRRRVRRGSRRRVAADPPERLPQRRSPRLNPGAVGSAAVARQPVLPAELRHLGGRLHARPRLRLRHRHRRLLPGPRRAIPAFPCAALPVGSAAAFPAWLGFFVLVTPYLAYALAGLMTVDRSPLRGGAAVGLLTDRGGHRVLREVLRRNYARRGQVSLRRAGRGRGRWPAPARDRGDRVAGGWRGQLADHQAPCPRPAAVASGEPGNSKAANGLYRGGHSGPQARLSGPLPA